MGRQDSFRHLSCSLAISIVRVRISQGHDTGSSLICSCEIEGKPLSKFQTSSVNHQSSAVWNYIGTIPACTFGEPLTFVVTNASAPHDSLGRAQLRSRQFYTSGYDGVLHVGSAIVLTLRVVVTPCNQHEHSIADFQSAASENQAT